MKRDEVLDTAKSLINGDRAKDYGDAAENYERVAKLWGAYLGVELTAEQALVCMTLVKVARLAQAPGHEDSWVDAAGYIALGGEVATKKETATAPPSCSSYRRLPGHFVKCEFNAGHSGRHHAPNDEATWTTEKQACAVKGPMGHGFCVKQDRHGSRHLDANGREWA